MNRITIELCPEDRARIDALTEALRAVGTPFSAPAASFLEKEFHIPAETPAVPATPVEETAPPVKVVSLAEFQKALTERCAQSANMKARVRALLNEYAESASTVPEDKRAEVLEKLAQLPPL